MNISHNERLWGFYSSLPAALQNFAVSLAGWFKQRRDYGKALRNILGEYLEGEFLPLAELKHLQIAKLRALLDHAQRNVPYYTRLFAARGFDPASVTDLSDLQALPLLTKQTIRENFDALVSRDHKKRGSFVTLSSGTTGTPLRVIQDANTLLHEKVWIARHRLAHGFLPGREWRGTFNGTRAVPDRLQKPPFWRVNRPGKQVFFSSRHLSLETAKDYYDYIARSEIECLDGYPAALYIFARLINLHDLHLSLRAVFCGAEPIFPHYREEMERAFGCPVHDYYGLAEKNISAGDCPHASGLHLGMEDCIVELVDADSHEVIREEGKRGLLVGTSLENYSMPLIRYATGDVSAYVNGSCGCGRKAARIEPVFSQLKNLIKTPDGKWIAGSIVTFPIKYFRGILESQIAQTDTDLLEVRIVPITELSSDETESFRRTLGEHIGNNMRVVISLTDHIPRTPAGKYVSVTCEIDNGIPKID